MNRVLQDSHQRKKIRSPRETKLRHTDLHVVMIYLLPTAGRQKQPNQQSHFTKPAKCLLTRMQAIHFLWTSDGQDGSPGLTEDRTGVRREGDVALKGIN